MAKKNTEVIPRKDNTEHLALIKSLESPFKLDKDEEVNIAAVVALDRRLDDNAMETYWKIGRYYVAMTAEGSKYGKNLADELAKRMNKSPRLVTDSARYYRLLEKPAELAEVVTNYPNLSWTHHRSLLSLDDSKQRQKCMATADKKKLSTRELDVEIKVLRKGPVGKAKDVQSKIKQKNNPMTFLQEAINRTEKLSLEKFSMEITGIEGSLSGLPMITPRLNLESTTPKELEDVVYKLEEVMDLLEARRQACVVKAQEDMARLNSLYKSVAMVYDNHTEEA